MKQYENDQIKILLRLKGRKLDRIKWDLFGLKIGANILKLI